MRRGGMPFFFHNKSLAFYARGNYNRDVMELTIVAAIPPEIEIPAREEFKDARKVQGGTVSVCRNAVLIESSGRFKRFSDAKEYIRIEAGEGHFKWKRGELPFSAGDLFFADALEEYDFYGTGIFLIVKAQS